jgi:hypothetical protein
LFSRKLLLSIFILAFDVEEDDEDEDMVDEDMVDDESVNNPRQDEETKRRLEDELALVAEERSKLAEEKMEAHRQAQNLRDILMKERLQLDEMHRKTALELAEEKKATKEAKWQLSQTILQFTQQQEQDRQHKDNREQQIAQIMQQQQQQKDRLRREQEAAQLVQQQQQEKDRLRREQEEKDRLRREQEAAQLVQQQQQENDRLRREQEEKDRLRREQEAAQLVQQQQQQENDQLRREQAASALVSQSSTHATAAAFIQPSPPKPPKEREFTTDRSMYEVRGGVGRKERALDDREGRTIKTGVQRDKRVNAQLNHLAKKRNAWVSRKRIQGEVTAAAETTGGEEVTAAAGTTGGEEVAAAAETTGGEEVAAAAETTGNEVATTHVRRSLRGQRTVLQTADMWDNIAGGALRQDQDQDIIDLLLDQGDAAEKAMTE